MTLRLPLSWTNSLLSRYYNVMSVEYWHSAGPHVEGVKSCPLQAELVLQKRVSIYLFEFGLRGRHVGRRTLSINSAEATG